MSIGEIMRKAIGVILTMLMICDLLHVAYEVRLQQSKKEEVTPKKEIVETVEYLSEEELSKLYSYKQDIRKTDENIIELDIEDAVLLMQIARSEGGDSLEGQLWVMSVVINRLQDGDFGDSIVEIVSADRQFEVYSNRAYLTAELNANSHIALAMLEAGKRPNKEALYFEASSNTSNSWHSQNLSLIKEIEGQRYYAERED